MEKQLFFDDALLLGRENVKRVYGKAERIAEYSDGLCSTDFCSGNVFRLDNGKYRMLYYSHSTAFEGKKLFCAISDDGIHFQPEAIESDSKRDYPHELLPISGESLVLSQGSEIATIFEDPKGKGNGRYKLLMAEYDGEGYQQVDTLYVSEDLIHWQKREGVFWGEGTEPLTGVFYNEKKNEYTVLLRPYWGVRTVGAKITKDWKEFTPYQQVLGVDSCDDPLDEMYGMHAFSYDGAFIGVPHLYRGLHSEYNAKYANGIIECQLAYSFDGRYWRRSLREPFLSGGKECPMVWLVSMVCREEDVLLYGTASELEHGPAFHEPGHGRLFIYRLRKDGFIALESEDGDTPSKVLTREKVWHGGDLHLNVNAKNVTVGVYETVGEGNLLAFTTPIEGYRAEDCIPFTGDSIDFVPQFQNGKTLDALKGKTLVFEINYTDGTLYSLCGDYTDVFNTQGARYRTFGVLPK